MVTKNNNKKMKINPYEHRTNKSGSLEGTVTDEFKNLEFYIFCLNVGKVSKINRHVPITKVKFHDLIYNRHFVFKSIETLKEIDYATNFGTCELYGTYESAFEAFQELKQNEINRIQQSIDSILLLQEKIKNL